MPIYFTVDSNPYVGHDEKRAELKPLAMLTQVQRNAALIDAVVNKPLYIREDPAGITVEGLLGVGVDPNFFDTMGYSAVFHVLSRKPYSEQLACYQLLFAAGANLSMRRVRCDGDPTLKANRCETALHWAIVYSSFRQSPVLFEQLLQVLVEHNIAIDVANDDGCTPLHYIVDQECSAATLRLYLTHTGRFDVDAQDKKQVSEPGSEKVDDENVVSGGETALAIACQMTAMTPHVRMLVDAGADPNIMNGFGWAPLHYAVMNGNFESFCFMYMSPRCKGRFDTGNVSPRQIAARTQPMPAVSGADVSPMVPKLMKNVTLLRLAQHAACNMAAIRALLEEKLASSDGGKKSAAMLKKSHGRGKYAHDEWETELCDAARNRKTSEMARLLEKRTNSEPPKNWKARLADVNLDCREKGLGGVTPLIMCIQKCCFEGVKMLLDAGASPRVAGGRLCSGDSDGDGLSLPVQWAAAKAKECNGVLKTLCGQWDILDIFTAGKLGHFFVSHEIMLGRNGQYKSLWARKLHEWKASAQPKVRCDLQTNGDPCWPAQLERIVHYHETGKHDPRIAPFNIKDPEHECRKYYPDMTQAVLGVIALANIRKNTVLGLYSGEILNKNEHEKTYTTLSQLEHCYGMSLSMTCQESWSKNENERELSIDPKAIGNIFRCINDYRTGITFDLPQGTRPAHGNQNVQFQDVVVCGLPYMIVMTIADCCAGEELLVDYGDAFWESHRMMRQVAFDIQPLYDEIQMSKRFTQHQHETIRAQEQEIWELISDKVKYKRLIAQLRKYVVLQRDTLNALVAHMPVEDGGGAAAATAAERAAPTKPSEAALLAHATLEKVKQEAEPLLRMANSEMAVSSALQAYRSPAAATAPAPAPSPAAAAPGDAPPSTLHGSRMARKFKNDTYGPLKTGEAWAIAEDVPVDAVSSKTGQPIPPPVVNEAEKTSAKLALSHRRVKKLLRKHQLGKLLREVGTDTPEVVVVDDEGEGVAEEGEEEEQQQQQQQQQQSSSLSSSSSSSDASLLQKRKWKPVLAGLISPRTSDRTSGGMVKMKDAPAKKRSSSGGGGKSAASSASTSLSSGQSRNGNGIGNDSDANLEAWMAKLAAWRELKTSHRSSLSPAEQRRLRDWFLAQQQRRREFKLSGVRLSALVAAQNDVVSTETIAVAGGVLDDEDEEHGSGDFSLESINVEGGSDEDSDFDSSAPPTSRVWKP